MTTHVRFF